MREQAFNAFVEARSTPLLRTAYLLTRDRGLAEDLLQTALAKAWFSWGRIEGQPEAYVRRILVNTYATWWRRKWNGEEATGELPESTQRHTSSQVDDRTDLREELSSRTDGLDADPSSIAEGVTGRIRTTKRRRAIGAVGGLGAAALALGLVLTNQGSPLTPAPVPAATLGADGMPSRLLPAGPDDVVKDGLRYRARVGEDKLAAGVIGDDSGQRSVTATWIPTTNRISYVAECWLLPGTDQAVAEDTMVRASISGAEGHVESSCESRPPDSGDLSTSGYVPGEPGQGHPELQVGSTTTLTVELVTRDGAPAAVPGARLAAAVYDLGPQRLIEDDAGRVVGALPEVSEHQGFAYRLEALVAGPAATGPLPEVATPSGVPFLVAYGSTSPAGDPTVGSLQLVGLDAESSYIQGGGWSTLPQPARVAGAIELRSEGPRAQEGVAFIAIYTPAN